MNIDDPHAENKAAEAAGATIQGYTLYSPDDGMTELAECTEGYWRDLESPVLWTCDPSRYRIKPDDAAPSKEPKP